MVFNVQNLVRPEDSGNFVLNWYYSMATQRDILGTANDADSNLYEFQ